MARNFSVANTRMTNGTFGGSGTTGTVSIWLNPAWSSGDSVIRPLWFLSNTATSDLPSLQKYSDNNIYAGFNNVTDDRIVIADTGLFTSGTWANWVFTWTAAGACVLYKDGVSVGSVASATLTSGTGWCLGEYPTGVGNTTDTFNGSLAEFAYWNVVLSAGEIAALSRGVNTQLVRPSAITLYVPLWGLASPEPELSGSAFNGTLSGSIAYATHAPVTLWTPNRPQFLAASAAAVRAPARMLRGMGV